MWKTILCLLLVVVFLVSVPLLSGCQEKEGDRVSIERKTNVENVPVGEPKIKLTGDNPP
jgi:hypothetical protein